MVIVLSPLHDSIWGYRELCFCKCVLPLVKQQLREKICIFLITKTQYALFVSIQTLASSCFCSVAHPAGSFFVHFILNMLFLICMLFYLYLILFSVHPLIFPLCSVPSTLPPLPHFLPQCFLSLHSLSAVRWCCPVRLPNRLPPSLFHPHTSLPSPPDAINTQHRWVIAQTYQLPLHPHPPCSPLSAQAHCQTSHIFPPPLWPSHLDNPAGQSWGVCAWHGAASDTERCQRSGWH